MPREKYTKVQAIRSVFTDDTGRAFHYVPTAYARQLMRERGTTRPATIPLRRWLMHMDDVTADPGAGAHSIHWRHLA